MVLSDQLVPGMVLSMQGLLYRVENVIKVNMPKGGNLLKVSLKDLSTHTVSEKNFKMNQTLNDVTLQERRLEYLYEEGKYYVFLEIQTVEQMVVPKEIIGEKILFLKEGIEVKGMIFEEKVYGIELPQFLELAIAKTEDGEDQETLSANRKATLETGAVIEVPAFVDVGDVVRVNPHTEEFVQRVYG